MEEEYEAPKQNGIKGQQHFYSFQKFPVSFQLLFNIQHNRERSFLLVPAQHLQGLKRHRSWQKKLPRIKLNKCHHYLFSIFF